MIENILFEHDRPFTIVKTSLQPRCKAESLTSVAMDKFSTIAERLDAAMKDAGVTPSQLARDCSVSPAAVHKWQNGGKLSADSLAAASRSLGIREEWLRTGKLPREREKAAEEEAVDRVIALLKTLREPLSALAAAIEQLQSEEPVKKRSRG